MKSPFKAGLQLQAEDSSAQRWALDELDLSDEADAMRGADAADTSESRVAAQAAQREADERERELADAYARGLEDGHAQGARAEAVRMRDMISAAEQALDAIRAGETRWQGMIEENICALAIGVARQVVVSELRSDSEMVAELVRRALAEFPIDQPVRIRVHPLDLAAINVVASSDDAPAPIVQGREMRWQADASLTPGGCVVEGRDRIIDGRVDTALERLYRRLTHTNA